MNDRLFASDADSPPDLMARLGPPPNAGASTGTKHAELSEWLRLAIQAGVLKAGDKLPTETEFASSTSYSLGTVQRAIRTLVDEGLVERKPRTGTFVARRRRKIDTPWHFRFVDSDRRTLLPVYPKVLSRTAIRQRGPWNDYIGGALLRIDRLVNVNDEFNAYSRFYVDASRFPVFAEVPLEALDGENFRVLLNRQIVDPVERICHRIAFGNAPAAIARVAGFPPDQACVLVDIAASSDSDDYLYYQELFVPPSDRRLELADPNSVHQLG